MINTREHGIDCGRCGKPVEQGWNYCEICGVALRPATVNVFEAQRRMRNKCGGFFELKPELFPVSEDEYVGLEADMLENLNKIFDAAKRVRGKKESTHDQQR